MKGTPVSGLTYSSHTPNGVMGRRYVITAKTAAVAGGPYGQLCVPASQFYFPGSLAGQIYSPGAYDQETYSPGATESQIGC